VHEQLARLDPPRKHYQWYYSTREANADMHDAPQGIHDFLRAYYHYKSADWARNNPVPLKSFTAGELAKLPTYYIMELHKGMAATVAPEMPSPAEIASCQWLTEQELKVYSTEYLRTGFQGGLNWYRCRTQNVDTAELEMFSGRQIEVPSLFIAGRKDWGIYQVPGSIERMRDSACTRMRSCILVEGAGHWVQQEQPQRVSELLIEFLNKRDR
jgi:pimeloyl-ACP methyl ester carboxylesterase